MLDIPEVIKELFKQDGIRKNFRVHFPNGERADLVNKDIIEESVKFTESTCSQQTLRFGLTEASVIEFECVGVENIAGMTIECGIEIDVSSLSREDRLEYGTRTDDVAFPFYAVPYGVFVVDKCPRQADMKRRKVTGYTEIDQRTLLPLEGWYKKNVLKLTTGALLDLMDGGMIPCDDFYQVKDIKSRPSPREDYPEYTVLGYSSVSSAAEHVYIRYGAVTQSETGLVTARTVSPEFSHDSIVAAKMDFIPHEYDDIGDEIYRGAVAALNAVTPAGVYGRNTETFAPVKNANTTRYNALQLLSGRPQIQAVLKKDNVCYFAYPHFVSTGETVLIDLINEVFDVSVVIDETCTFSVWYTLPIKWGGGTVVDGIKRGDTIFYNGGYSFTNWPIDVARKREGDPKAYYKSTKASGEGLSIKSTLKATMPQTGESYRYNNAISTEDAVNGILESAGLFGNVKRDGQLKLMKLGDGDRFTVNRTEIMEVWSEEQFTNLYGAVNYAWNDGTETSEYQYRFSDNPGVYDMTKNKLFEMLEDKTQAAIERLLQAFAENTASAAYTPIDLSMRGLPYLEDGDPIWVYTQSGGATGSYILRRTISGVQHLVDDIETQGDVG